MGIIKSHKKDGVALILILIIISSVIMTIMASVKVVTRSHTKYTTGKGYGDAVNANKSSGKFICYKDKNGNLQQITINYRADGSADKPADLNKLDGNGNCVFQVQKGVSLYKITLIGGGGGGAVPYAEGTFNRLIDTSGENAIIVGQNQTKFKKLFAGQSRYIDVDSTNSNIYNNFFGNLHIEVKAPDAPIYNGVQGAPGAMCTAHITSSSESPMISQGIDLVDKILYYGSTPAEYPAWAKDVNNNNAIIELESNKFTAYGGLGALIDNGEYFTPAIGCADAYRNTEACGTLKNMDPYYKRYATTGVGKCVLYNGTESYKESSGNTTISNATSVSDPSFTFGVTYKGTEYTTPQNSSFKFALKENVADIFEATAGEPGAITEFETKYLTKTEDKITIKASNLGVGGLGGTKTSRNGKNGTETTLVLDTRAGIHTLSANGGLGGTTSATKTLEGYNGVPTALNIGSKQIFSGKNGSQANFTISGDFGINDLNPGVTLDTTANISKATMPGSSGASGILIWNGVGSGAASPWVEYMSSGGAVALTDNAVYLDTDTTKYYTATEVAGQGSDGAIVIEW